MNLSIMARISISIDKDGLISGKNFGLLKPGQIYEINSFMGGLDIRLLGPVSYSNPDKQCLLTEKEYQSVKSDLNK